MKFALIVTGMVSAGATTFKKDVPKEDPRQLGLNGLFRQQTSYYDKSESGAIKYPTTDGQDVSFSWPSKDKYYQDYNDIDYAQESSYSGHGKLKSKTHGLPHSKYDGSSPAMSAVALLGFLYFLNLIQNVLQPQGRKKRSVNGIQKENAAHENVKGYMTTLENAIDSLTGTPIEREAGRSRLSMHERASGITSFFGYMFNKIKSVFGFNGEPISRSENINPIYNEPAAPGLWSLLGKKVGMIATISDFLDDPSPTRLKRAFVREHERNVVEDGVELAEERDLNEEELSFLPKRLKRKGKNLSRKRRYTDDGMNVWYDIARTRDEEQFVVGPQQILGTIFNLLRKTVISSE